MQGGGGGLGFIIKLHKIPLTLVMHIELKRIRLKLTVCPKRIITLASKDLKVCHAGFDKPAPA